MSRRPIELETRQRAVPGRIGALGRIGAPAERIRRRLRQSALARRILRRRVVGLTMVVVVTAVVHHVVAEADEVQRAWGATRAVVVTSGPVAVGELLDASNTVSDRRPDRFVPDGALTETPSGRRADHDLARSEVITDSALGSPGAGAVASQLPDDTVGITVSTGDLRPPVAAGDVVDLYASPGDGSALETSGSVEGPRRVATSATVIGLDGDQVTVAVATDDAADASAASVTGPVALVLVHPD